MRTLGVVARRAPLRQQLVAEARRGEVLPDAADRPVAVFQVDVRRGDVAVVLDGLDELRQAAHLRFRRAGAVEVADQADADARRVDVELPDLAGGLLAVPALGDLLVDFEQDLLEVTRLMLARLLVEFERDIRAVSEPADGLDKTDVFVFLNEGEHVAALVAAETVKDLPMRTDVEAWRLLFVKWTECEKIGPCSL